EKLDIIGIERVAGVGKSGECNGRFDLPRHSHWIEGAADFKALIGFHVDDLVRRWRGHMDTGADERHEQELFHCGRVEVERYDVPADRNVLPVEFRNDGRWSIASW